MLLPCIRLTLIIIIVTRESTSPETALPGSQKRTSSNNIDEEPERKRLAVQGLLSLRGPQTPEETYQKTQGVPDEPIWCPFTDVFFNDMATFIGRDFPVTEFAKRHNCNNRDVLHALHAVVMAPLRRTQPWHEGMSVSENAQILIANWRCDEEPGIRRTASVLPTPQGSQESPILICDDSSSDASVIEANEFHGPNPLRHILAPFLTPEEVTQEESPADDSGKENPSVSWERISVHSAPAGLETDTDIQPRCPAPTPVESTDRSTSGARPPLTVEMPIPRRQGIVNSRTQCRKTANGVWIPVDKWIKGYHRTAGEEEEEEWDSSDI